MLREAGAVEVHVRIASPPVKWPCFYGIDFATRAELLANGLDADGIRRSIGADTLGYASLSGVIAATEQPRTRLCRACFDGVYPIELPADNVIGKHVLEGLAKTAAVATGSGDHAAQRRGTQAAQPGGGSWRSGAGEPVVDDDPIVASPGGTDALLRP
jgi:amidophosphoribosyltransferase